MRSREPSHTLESSFVIEGDACDLEESGPVLGLQSDASLSSFHNDPACHDPHLGLESGKLADPTIVDHGDHHHHKKSAGKRNINAFQLAMLTYFFTCGGPFGIEPSVGAAGPVITLVALFLVPVLWSLPQALMSAELSLMVDENGGNIVWVQRAFGPFIGWINAFNYLVSAFASMALYPILVIAYLPQHWQDDLTDGEAFAIKFGFVFIIMLINMWGISWVTRLSLIFLFFILSPFLAEFIALPIMGGLQWDRLGDVPAFTDIQWSLFISTTLWSFGGYDSMGSVAGEVKDGRKTYITGISIGLPLNILNYFLPVLVGWVYTPDRSVWVSGYFTTLAYKMSSVLGYYMMAASVMSNFGTFNVTMASMARVLWAMARAPGDAQQLPSFVALSWRRAKTGTIRPIMGIVIVAIVVTMLSLLSYDILVQVTMFMRVVNLLLEYFALIRLKYTEPDTPRPFVVPGGKLGAYLIVLPTIALSGLLFAGGDWQLWTITGGANVIIVLTYFLKVAGQWLWRRYSPLAPNDEETKRIIN